MNRPSLIVQALIVALMLASVSALAQTSATPLSSIQAAARKAVLAQAAPGVEASADAMDPRLKLPACASPLQAEVPPPRGAVASVAVRCEGPTPWTVYVAVRLRELRKIPVLVQAVSPNQVADASLFMLQIRDVAALPQGYLLSIEQAVGQRFRRGLSANAVPAPADLSPPRWVRRGDPVQLIGRAGAIEVRAEGRALADGLAGGRVRVENLRSRRVVEGVVSAPGLVEVQL